MDQPDPREETCLTPEERQEVDAAWQTLQTALQPVGAMIDQGDLIDCDDLHTAFLLLADTFERLERAVMRPQQIRLHHAQNRHSADGG